jgi:hypothetical protein
VGVHPFDQYRHLYDDRFTNDGDRMTVRSQQQHDLHNVENIRRRRGNNNRMMKWLNNNVEYNDEKNDNNNSKNKQQQRQIQEETTPPTYITTTLNPSTDSLYQPLRIQFDVRHLIKEMENESSSSSSNTDFTKLTKLYLLIYEILPMTAQVWGDILRVIPVSGGIYPLDSTKGSSAGAWLPKNDGTSDSGESDAGTKNGGSGSTTAEADSVLYDDPVRAFYCPDDTTSGISGGADLLIYATVNRHCGSGPPPGTSNNNRDKRRRRLEETLASALSCQRDQYDRPVTGSIDFCLSGMNGVSNIDVDAAIASKEGMGLGLTPNDFGENVIVGSYGASMEWEGWYGKVVDEDSPLEDNIYVVQYAAGVAIHGKQERERHPRSLRLRKNY